MATILKKNVKQVWKPPRLIRRRHVTLRNFEEKSYLDLKIFERDTICYLESIFVDIWQKRDIRSIRFVVVKKKEKC